MLRREPVVHRRDGRAQFVGVAAAQHIVLRRLSDDVSAAMDPQQRRSLTRHAGRAEQPNPDPRRQGQHLDVVGRFRHIKRSAARMNGTVTGVTICLGIWRATRRRSGWNSAGDTCPVLRQVCLECDAVSAVQGANQLDRPPVDIEGTAIEQ